MSSPPVFSGVRVTRSLVLYVCFVDRCLFFCTFQYNDQKKNNDLQNNDLQNNDLQYKDRQYNDQKKNNDLQYTTQKTEY
jgi:hypothetical protein